jgi:hypothetical protein
MFRRFLLTAAVAVTATIGYPAFSRADVVVTLTVGADTLTIDANQSGFITLTDPNLGSSNPIQFQGGSNQLPPNIVGVNPNGNGAVTYINYANNNDFVTTTTGGIITSLAISGFTFDGYTFNVNTISSNAPGTPQSATLNLVINTLQVAAANYSGTNQSGFQSGNLLVGAAEGNIGTSIGVPGGATNDSYTNPVGIDYLTNVGQYTTNSSLPGGVTMTTGGSYINGANTPPPLTTPISLLLSGPGGSIYGGSTSSAPFTSTPGFELTSNITLTGINAGATFGNGDQPGTDSLQSQVTLFPTPAPTGLVLAATMVPFFGVLRRRLSKLATEPSVVA